MGAGATDRTEAHLLCRRRLSWAARMGDSQPLPVRMLAGSRASLVDLPADVQVVLDHQERAHR